jgi:ribonuclease P protein component
MGCAVSRKVGSAVVRNRIKRYVREVYRTHRGQLSNDVHLVIVARVASVGLDYQECAAAIHELFRKGDVLSG